jgi:hypothetical protein
MKRITSLLLPHIFGSKRVTGPVANPVNYYDFIVHYREEDSIDRVMFSKEKLSDLPAQFLALRRESATTWKFIETIKRFE